MTREHLELLAAELEHRARDIREHALDVDRCCHELHDLRSQAAIAILLPAAALAEMENFTGYTGQLSPQYELIAYMREWFRNLK